MDAPPEPLHQPRRRWLLAGVAGAAALAGIALAWRDGHRIAPQTEQEQALWDLAFPTPQGGQLAMRNFSGKPLLLNFWATWCPPCIDEMPLLNRFHVEHHANGWQVLGLAVDQKGPVERFLRQTPVQFPIALAGMAGVELSRSLGNQAGGLPFSVLFAPAGTIAQRKIGQLGAQDLQQWRSLDWAK